MFQFLPMAIGAGIGLLTNKKDPIQGALLGAATGAAGGILSPTASAIPATQGIGQSAASGLMNSAASASSAPLVEAASAPWWQSAAGIADAVKPYTDAAGAAMQVAQETKEPEMQITPSPMITPMPNSNLGAMVTQMEQSQANKIEQEKQARFARRKARGGYGLIG